MTTTPSGLSTSVTYNGSATAPTNGGSYAVVATITDPNYTGSASGTLVIAKANQTITFAALGQQDLRRSAVHRLGDRQLDPRRDFRGRRHRQVHHCRRHRDAHRRRELHRHRLAGG